MGRRIVTVAAPLPGRTRCSPPSSSSALAARTHAEREEHRHARTRTRTAACHHQHGPVPTAAHDSTRLLRGRLHDRQAVEPSCCCLSPPPPSFSTRVPVRPIRRNSNCRSIHPPHCSRTRLVRSRASHIHTTPYLTPRRDCHRTETDAWIAVITCDKVPLMWPYGDVVSDCLLSKQLAIVRWTFHTSPRGPPPHRSPRGRNDGTPPPTPCPGPSSPAIDRQPRAARRWFVSVSSRALNSAGHNRDNARTQDRHPLFR